MSGFEKSPFCVTAFDTAAIQDFGVCTDRGILGRQPPAYMGVDVLRLFRRCRHTGADRPDGLVGNHSPIQTRNAMTL